jgi:hypothetical protein
MAKLSTLSSTNWEEKFFPNAKLTCLEIELFEQDLNEMREYLARGTFENENEGWRFLLTTGYAYLRGKERLMLPDGSGIDPQGVEENLKRQVEIEAMYAVLKQRAYVWMKDNQTMDMQSGALHTLALGFKARVQDLTAENQALQAEIARLRAQLPPSAPIETMSNEPTPSTPTPSPSLIQRLLKRT